MSTPFPLLALISGPEEVLAERAVDAILGELRDFERDAETVRLAASSYAPGDLLTHASPSLFGGWTAIVISGLEEASDPLLEDVLTYLDQQPDSVVLILRHKGGNRGKRVVDAVKKAGARVVEAKAIKSEGDKVAFVTGEFQAARRKISRDATVALVNAVGRDVRELASACSQLIRDTKGMIDVADVELYYGERVETTGFKVAEAALGGKEAEALRLLRHAMSGGLDPVPIVAVLAMQLRQVGRVASAGPGPSASMAKQLGMAPWQIDQARRVAQGWNGARLGAAIQAVAEADVEVKGGLRNIAHRAGDPAFAVERAVVAICALRKAA